MNFFEDIKKQIEQNKLFLIAYYGASTTSAEYCFPNWGEIIRYVLKDALEESTGIYQKAYWNLQTMNMGLNGALSADLLERFDFWVLDKNPNLIFLNVGKNDPYRNIDKEVTRKNTKTIIEKSLEKNIKVVFTTTMPALRDDLNKKVLEYIKVDQEIAEYFKGNENFIFVDLFNFFPKEAIKKSYTLIGEENNNVGVKEGETDPIHYNRYGNAIVAKILLKKVFDIDFDEEKFLKDLTDPTVKYPSY
jgi:lysophospholipase L1-like esterase